MGRRTNLALLGLLTVAFATGWLGFAFGTAPARWSLALHAATGFGILLLFFIFEAGFMAACMLFAEPVLQALTWPAIAVGNLLAALAMGAIFWRAHRSLTVQP